MIKEVVGNLLETTECNVIVHQCNLFHTFGAGIAKAIKDKFPEAYEADKKTVHGSAGKLGTYSVAQIQKGTGSIQIIVNLYSQTGIGGQDRQTSYDAMVTGLTLLCKKLEEGNARGKSYVLGIPFQIGCGLANGSWPIVRAIIEDIFGKSPVQVLIYTLPELVQK